MFKKPLLVIAALAAVLLPQFAYSQPDLKITWGEKGLPQKKRTEFALLGENPEKDLVVLKKIKSDLYLEKYDKDDLSIKSSERIDLKLKKNENSKKNQLEYEGVLIMSDGIVVFASKYDKDAERFNLFAAKYNFELDREESWEKIETIVATKKRNTGEFGIKLSDDKTKFLVTQALPKKKKEIQKFDLTVFDSKFEKLVTLNYKAENIKEDTDIWGERISKDGRVYFFTETAETDILHSFEIGSEPDGEEPEVDEYELKFDKKEIVSAAFAFNKSGELVISGFYSDKTNKKNYGISGIYYAKVDAVTLEETHVNTSAFDAEFLDIFLSDRQIRKGKGISTTYLMKNFIFREDGSCTMVAENHYITQQCSQSGNVGGIVVTTCVYYYHYNELMVIHVDGNGNIMYNHYLKKFASSKNYNDGRISYSVIPAADGVHILYNDHFKNYREDATRVRNYPFYRKGVLAQVFISNNGEISKKALFRHKEMKLEPMPRHYVKTTNGIIMMGYYKKTMKLGRFEVE